MDYYDYYGFRPYVSVAARRAQAARELAKLQKKGRKISPVAIEGRKIARTFWGEAWCDNLERYSDYANRLPRGRTYVRNGSVVDLQVGPGRVTALVSGSTMYDVKVTVGPVPRVPLECHLRGLLGRHRLARRAPAGTLLEGRHDAPLRGEDGAVPVTEGHPLHLQLSGLGVDVQARGGGAVRHRRATGSSAGAALHAPQGRSAGFDCEGRVRSREEGQGDQPARRCSRATISRRCSASRWRRRHRRSGASATRFRREPSPAVTVDVSSKQKGHDPAGETEGACAHERRVDATADTGEATSDIGTHA